VALPHATAAAFMMEKAVVAAARSCASFESLEQDVLCESELELELEPDPELEPLPEPRHWL
jgi:hypothetical protein